MSKILKFRRGTSSFDVKTDQKDFFPQKGQRVIYEKEEAKVLSVNPLLVIRTKNRVICGALQERFEYI